MPRVLLCLLCLLAPGWALAERVADLPMPTRYVNDFAGVLSPSAAQQLEDTCRELHDQAHADVAVVTIKTLEDGQTIDDFTVKLEEKWKLGQGGTGENSSRGLIYLLVMSPRGSRVEVGYGLEGILPDAKVGRLLDAARPQAQQGDTDGEVTTVVDGIAQVIAADAGVTLTPVQHTYRRQQAPQQGIGAGQIVLALLFVVVLAVLIKTGNLGWALVLLMNVLGNGGGGGGGGGDDEGGGGFGGSGGGSSGGGGASRDF